MLIRPHYPSFGTTQSISATATSSSVTLTNVGQQVLYVVNEGPDGVYIRYGNGAQTALTTDYRIPANTERYLTRRDGSAGDTVVAAVCDSGETATVYVSIGEGS